MASYLRQSLTVLRNKRDKKPRTLFIIRRTGYMNLFLNGIHYYYNVHEQTDDLASIDLEKIAQQSQSNGKQLLVIRRK